MTRTRLGIERSYLVLKPMLTAGIAAAVLAISTPVHAQEAPRFSVGVFAGAQSVERVGSQAGLDVSLHSTPRLALFGELSWLQNIVTRRRLGTAEAVAAYLSQTQGQTVVETMSVPAWAATVGTKLFLTEASTGGLRPYATVQAGVARVTLRPAFTLAGADVTTAMDRYGVTLGEDLTGSSLRPAYGGGFGVALNRGEWTIDAGFRLLSVQTKEQATNVVRVAVGLARGF